MKNLIKKVIKLNECTTDAFTGLPVNIYHVYIQEPTFNSDPVGVIIEEKITDSEPIYKVRPLGVRLGTNIFYGTDSLTTTSNNAKDFVNWVQMQSQQEIKNIIHGRSLLFS